MNTTYMNPNEFDRYLEARQDWRSWADCEDDEDYSDIAAAESQAEAQAEARAEAAFEAAEARAEARGWA